MPWSTSQLADLAGTTVNTVRHYHRAGLLEEPDRMSNGYKQYTVRHLLRLLRIRRLAELGIPLAQIEAVSTDDAGAAESLRALQAELRERISHLEEACAQIAALLAESAPADTPPGFESLSSDLSEADRSLLQIYSQLYSPEAMADVRTMIESSTAAAARFDALPADADEQSRAVLAEELAPALTEHLEAFPWLLDPSQHFAQDATLTRRTFLEALREIYNPAQLDVMGRTEVLAAENLPSPGQMPDPGETS